MKKLFIFIGIITTTFILQVTANAANSTVSQPGSSKSNNQLIGKSNFGGDCFGETQKPHFSSHIPGTINVTARTVCLGHRVSVQSWLYLGFDEIKGKKLNYKWADATNEAKANTAWKCVLGKMYVITAISDHEDDRGHAVQTRYLNSIYCGKPKVKIAQSSPVKK